MRLSQRVQSLKPSSTIAVTTRARQLRAEGVDVLSFAAGEPDFDTPERIKKAAKAALDSGMTKYTPIPGDPETRGVIARKLTEENRIPGLTPEHVVISSGGKQSLYLIFQALLDPAGGPGEDPPEVLIPTPAWVSYGPQAELAGARVVEIRSDAESGFRIRPEQLRAAITPRSRILILNSPSNPCGTMYSPDEIRALAAVVEEAARTTAPDLVVVTDEMYEKIVYGGIDHFSFGSIPAVAERTITVNGLSKAYAMTGWRIGYAAGSGEFGLRLAKALSKLQGQMTTCIASFFLPAIRVALTECADEVEMMRRAFAARAELMHGMIGTMPGLVCPKPTGAFYVFPDISAHFGKTSAGDRPIASAADFAQALLDEHHIAAVPGEDFLGCGPRCVRFSFACSEEQIEAGMKRVGEFVAGLG
ncbi:MAG: pyridoxal phosphate-dependent aminotransferase [Phycisphaeraceae bacterium]|nr:MAG: pyridoxal phosphate-dependent aminotransferase [Phycisphaeraceae bacterium]